MFKHHSKSQAFRDGFAYNKQGFPEPLPNLGVLVAASTAGFKPLLQTTFLMPYVYAFAQLGYVQDAIELAQRSIVTQQGVVAQIRGQDRAQAKDVLMGFTAARDELLVLSQQKRILFNYMQAVEADLEMARDLAAACVRKGC